MIMAIERSGMNTTADAIKTKLLDFESSSVHNGVPGTVQTFAAEISKHWNQTKDKNIKHPIHMSQMSE